jgi:PAB-dependent poly(A)-specific ribonuclease subunit 2
MSHKATCQNCKVVRTFDSNRFVAASDLPPVLAVNANVYNEETLEHWLDTRKHIFLAPTVELFGQFYEGEEPTSVSYNLRVCTLPLRLAMMSMAFQAIIVQVLSKEGRSHLVAIVKGKALRSAQSLTLKIRPQFQKQKILKARSALGLSSTISRYRISPRRRP